VDANRIRDLVATQKDIPSFSTGLGQMADPTMELAGHMRKHRELLSEGKLKKQHGFYQRG
jgi:hypothetical protein